MSALPPPPLHISISPLLTSLLTPTSPPPSPSAIASALALIFTNQLSPPQCASLLTLLSALHLDQSPAIIAACAARMRDAATKIDTHVLRRVIRERGERGRREGNGGGCRREGECNKEGCRRLGGYRGGLCDIVGTGGDGHSTFNVSTTASIVASALVMVGKHGNRASSSLSGSADLLQHILPQGPVIENVTAETLHRVYEKTNYAFLFAPKFHPGMRFVAPIRKDLGFRTIFNILGPLANPVEGLIEARVVGVARRELGAVFAEALRLGGAQKSLVVCGEEGLDEISCAGRTECWMLVERANPALRGGGREGEEDGEGEEEEEAELRMKTVVETFWLCPGDFGLACNGLERVAGGKGPGENAEVLMRLLSGQCGREDPVLGFVLLNAAALFVMAGVCEAEESAMGEGDDEVVIRERGPGGGRWKEGVRRARWAVESGEALRQLEGYIEATNNLGVT